jgi:hypothetical protein
VAKAAHVATFAWETLGPEGEHSRQLRDRERRFQVGAKVRTNGQYEGWLFITVRSDESGWTHLVLDPDHTVVAQSYGTTKLESWDMVRAILAQKGIGAARAEDVE